METATSERIKERIEGAAIQFKDSRPLFSARVPFFPLQPLVAEYERLLRLADHHQRLAAPLCDPGENGNVVAPVGFFPPRQPARRAGHGVLQRRS